MISILLEDINLFDAARFNLNNKNATDWYN